MASNDYRFVTCWRLDNTTCAEVTEILGNAEDLVRWWPAVYLEVEVLDGGDADGIGKRVRLYTRGWLPYTLRWEFRVVEKSGVNGFVLDASGDFEGRGVWQFAPRDGGVDATYTWTIRAEKGLLKYGSLLLKPVFAWNHRWAMRQGHDSLVREIARRHSQSPRAQAPSGRI